MPHKISPLAPTSFPALPAIDGVRLSAGEAGIRYKNRTDVLLAELAEGTQVAGVFTTSLTASAPVLRCREHMKSGAARVLVVNSGNSNAFTGKAGEAAVDAVEMAAAELFACSRDAFTMASTGVIGEALPYQKIVDTLPALKEKLSADAWEAAARAIMTTDTFPKMATRVAEIGGVQVTLNGIAKGSGMIAPDMATMLAFVFTDAAIPHTALQCMLQEANAKTFNCITVDGDTSTSDTLLLFATGRANYSCHPERSEGSDGLAPAAKILRCAQDDMYQDFQRALHEVLHELALLVVKDGEGAEKLVTIAVTGAEHDQAARRIAFSIANSPLVKTALAAGDANWGRIVMAVGKAGEKADRDRLCIRIGGVSVARDGAADPAYREESIASHMQGREILIQADVGIGKGRATVWTCDLTHGYVDINGSYRS